MSDRTCPEQNFAHLPGAPEQVPPATNPQPETRHALDERDRLPNAPSVAAPDAFTAGNLDNAVDMMTAPANRFIAPPVAAPSAIIDRIMSPIVPPASGGKH